MPVSPCLVGIGMPVADVLCMDAYLGTAFHEAGFTPGKRHAMSETQIAVVEAALAADNTHYQIAAGGSMANTVCTVARLLPEIDCHYVALSADDNYGRIFRQALHDAGVSPLPALTEGSATSRSYVVACQGKDRAIGRFMGDSMDYLTPDDVQEAVVAATMVLPEGELLSLPHGYELWENILKSALRYNPAIVTSLFGVEQVERHRRHFLSLVERDAAILFGNAEELCALYSSHDVMGAITLLQKSLAARPDDAKAFISNGKEAAYCVMANTVLVSPAPAIPAHKIINSVGAGDGFMAGTLAGLLKGNDDMQAMALGHRIAGLVIQQEAAQLSTESVLRVA